MQILLCLAAAAAERRGGMTFMLELVGFILGAVALFAFNFWSCLREYDQMAQRSERRRRDRRKATERTAGTDGALPPSASH
jgi:hypothetical protein